MNAPPTRVVFLACGSFNPITNMHLRMFELARDHLHKVGNYKVTGGIVSPVSDGYEKKDLISATHRCAMAKLSLQSSDWIRLDSWESEQQSWTETRKVLDHHQNVLNSAINENLSPQKRPKLDVNMSHGDEVDNCIRTKPEPTRAPIQLKMLCGADLLESFGQKDLWKEEDITEIVSKYGLVVVTREGSNPYKFIYESDVLTKYQNNIVIVTEWITNEVSATKIRRALRRGESVKYLLQDNVVEYIQTNNLYGYSNNSKYGSVMLTPSPNCDTDVLDSMGNIIRSENSDHTTGVCMPRLMDIICLNNTNKAQQSHTRNPHLSTLV